MIHFWEFEMLPWTCSRNCNSSTSLAIFEFNTLRERRWICRHTFSGGSGASKQQIDAKPLRTLHINCSSCDPLSGKKGKKNSPFDQSRTGDQPVLRKEIDSITAGCDTNYTTKGFCCKLQEGGQIYFAREGSGDTFNFVVLPFYLHVQVAHQTRQVVTTTKKQECWLKGCLSVLFSECFNLLLGWSTLRPVWRC